MRTIAAAFLFAALSGVVFGQSTPSTTAPAAAAAGASASAAKTPVKFEIADIHPSPLRRYPFYQGAMIEDGRYILRQATLADLIATAYKLKDASYVHGGPGWLGWDRYDIVGKVPPGTTDATAREMLKTLLEDRFKLVAHEGQTEVPAYWLTVAPGGPKMQETPGGTGDGECHGSAPQTGSEPGAVQMLTLSCKNKSMAALADTLTRNRGGQYLQHPVVDKTGLKGAYDFDLKYTPLYSLSQAGGAGVTIFDAMQKELGLKLELKTMQEQGLVVDSVDETPAPNPPGVAKLLPPLPPAQFDVAVIKPAGPGDRGSGRIQGDEVDIHGLPLKFLIGFAWDLNLNDSAELVGAPKWMDSDRFDLLAKVAPSDLSPADPSNPNGLRIDIDQLQEMLRALIIDRFQMKAHMEDRPVDAYKLVAVDPKLTRADPSQRTGCNEGPGPDGKDPRLTHPVLNRLVTCQDMTIAEMTDEFQRIAGGYIYNPVVDDTGLQGRWDFTLSFSSVNLTQGSGHSELPTAGGVASAPDPNGAVSFFDAVNKQLGLKLEKIEHTEPVLVIDHIDQQPTPN